MPNEYRELLWSEGMFLRPHHFQIADRQWNTRLRQATEHLRPFNWGFAQLEIDAAAVSNYQFSVRSCQVILESGIMLSLPGNLELDSRQFRDAAGGIETLDVHIGVPSFRPDAGNTLSPDAQGGNVERRYRPDEVTAVDENTGDDPAPVSVKRHRGRLLWGTEDMTGYDTIQVGRVKLSGSGGSAVPDPAYFPPVLDISVWSPLLGVCEDISNGLSMANYALIRDFADREFTELLGIPRGIEAVVKMLATNRYVASLDQMCKTPRMHPYTIYLELLRLAATMGVFRGKRTAPALPDYQHDDLGKCFLGMKEIIDGLLDRIGTSTFVQRSFQLRNERLEVDLEESWVAGHRLFYIGVKGVESISALDRTVARLKICAPSDFATVTQKRLGGVGCRRLRMVPSSLPDREGTYYLQLEMEGEFWDHIERDKAIVVGGTRDVGYKFDLFVV